MAQFGDYNKLNENSDIAKRIFESCVKFPELTGGTNSINCALTKGVMQAGYYLKDSIFFNKEINHMQKIYDFVFRQLELSIREIGYGDASINKKMKTYVNTFHSILEKINNWENLDIDTKNKILNNFFNITEEMSILRNYLDKYRLFLLKSSLNSFTKGVINLKF